jgi:Uma2 family endonuclease
LDTKAKDCGTYWLGGPEFTVEITSPFDRSRDKFDFYAKVGVQELMIVDRESWQLEFYRLSSGQLNQESVASVKNGQEFASLVLGLFFRLFSGKHRPLIEVKSGDRQQSWLV